jgi:hypothetical protein
MMYRTGEPLKYTKYNCIFDELNGVIDPLTPHCHDVYEAWRIKAPGYIFDGIAIKTELRWLYGVNEKNLEE